MEAKKQRKQYVIYGAVILGLLVFIAVLAGKQSRKDIIILYTNDVHCGIEENIGYAGLASYKESAAQKTPYVTLVDCGDAIQGEFIGLTSQGSYMVDLMNEVGYDLAVLGNHEFDYGIEQLQVLMEQADAQYLGCNIEYSGKKENALSALKPYEILKYGDVEVAFIGVTTPESISSSTPTYFMEGGEYVYSFLNEEQGQELYGCVQKYVDECRKKGADYVIALTHLGDSEEYSPFSSVDLAQNTEGIDAVLDGHAHSVISCQVEKNRLGEEVLISSTGTKLANIGQLVITADGNVSTGLISSYQYRDEEMAAYVDGVQATYEEDLKKVIAVTKKTLTGFTQDGIRLVRSRETAIGNFCADAYRSVSGADIGLVNGGGVRADFEEGQITYEDLFAVHPFGNTLCMVEASGQEIMDCLEMCYRMVQPEFEENGNALGEDGGFQQVSGLKFTIDTSVEPSVVTDEYDMFVEVNGERRVKDVMVMDENGEYVPLDPAGTYTVASHNYLLKEGGSGCMMFADNTFLIDEGMQDYQVLATYLTQTLGGVVEEEYAQTKGRITVK